MPLVLECGRLPSFWIVCANKSKAAISRCTPKRRTPVRVQGNTKSKNVNLFVASPVCSVHGFPCRRWSVENRGIPWTCSVTTFARARRCLRGAFPASNPFFLDVADRCTVVRGVWAFVSRRSAMAGRTQHTLMLCGTRVKRGIVAKEMGMGSQAVRGTPTLPFFPRHPLPGYWPIMHGSRRQRVNPSDADAAAKRAGRSERRVGALRSRRLAITASPRSLRRG